MILKRIIHLNRLANRLIIKQPFDVECCYIDLLYLIIMQNANEIAKSLMNNFPVSDFFMIILFHIVYCGD